MYIDQTMAIILPLIAALAGVGIFAKRNWKTPGHAETK